MRSAGAVLVALCLAILASVGAGAQSIRVTGQLLAYQGGYVFFTTGDGCRVAPAVAITDAKTGGPTTLRPQPRIWAQATFDAQGTVVALALSRAPLPPEGDFALVRRFAIALSSPYPNPDLVQPHSTLPVHATQGSGRPVVVLFQVQVPATTPFDASIYITTDASDWNPQAIPMQRVDALHFRVVERLNVGTVFHYLFTRGSFASEERSQGGIEVKPRTVLVTNVDDQVYSSIVYRWADQSTGGELMQPNVFPTPYNPAPFPNLPPGIHTPAPGD